MAPDTAAEPLDDFKRDQHEWLAQQFEGLTAKLEIISPSVWAETNRYLPPSVTPLPGFYRFDTTPYLREIVDCFSVESPLREVAIMKGAQIGATVGVLENVIGYFIAHVSTAPMMMVTADAELAKSRLDSYIIPMLNESGLGHLIASADEGNGRKTGKTEKKLEWRGGGHLTPQGAKNADKMRSISAQVLLGDETDGWPISVGNNGDPVELTKSRTKAYESSRKLLWLSTPLFKGTSKIEKLFGLGDRRFYHVCCLGCGHSQILRWRHPVNEHGEEGGIFWEMDAEGKLIPGSTRYRCADCGHEHINDDKTRLLSPEHGAEWRATAVPTTPHRRSYHISALYSPVGMQTWEACVELWLEAWDVVTNRVRDVEKLQVFYNNVLGEPFEVRGERLRFETVSGHRRAWYSYGDIPNSHLEHYCGSRALLMTCAVDVHADSLKVGCFAWCRDRRAVLVNYDVLPDPASGVVGNTEDVLDPATWGALKEMLLNRVWTADDRRSYRPAITLIDSGYRADQTYQFCAQFNAVYPIKGREQPPKAPSWKHFGDFATPMGTTAYGITVDLYKDRWSAALRRQWHGLGLQPEEFFNAPLNTTDKQLKELTKETKQERIDKQSGKRLGFMWHRPSGSANELWDLLVYNAAALDLVAWDYCRNVLGLDHVNWLAFYEHALSGVYETAAAA